MVSLISLYAVITVLLNIPYIQQRISVYVSQELSRVLHTEVSIGQINVGLLNRIIIDRFSIKDQQKKPLLSAERLSAKLNIQSLWQGKVIIHNVQLYRMNLNLSQKDSTSAPNFRFLIDALSPKDTTIHTPLNLRINAVLIRQGMLKYDMLSEASTPGKFNPKHVKLDNLRANVSLKTLRNDSLNTTIRHLSFKEQSGFELSKLAFKLVATPQSFTLSRFALNLPSSQLALDTLQATYNLKAKNVLKTLRLQGGIANSYITLKDLQAFVPAFHTFDDPLWIRAKLRANAKEVSLTRFRLHSDNNDILLTLDCRVRNPFNPELSFIDCNLSQFHVSSTGLRFLAHNLGTEATPLITRMGNFSFEGSARGMLKDLLIRGMLDAGPGTVQTNLHLGLNKELKTYHGEVKAEEFQLGELLGVEDLGRVSLDLMINGQQTRNHYPEIQAEGRIPLLEYKQYAYNEINLNATYANGGFKGNLLVLDPNVNLWVGGEFNAKKALPEFYLTATVDHFRPDKLHLSEQYPDTEFSVKVKTGFKGSTVDKFDGNIQIDSLLMIAPEKYYYLDHFHVQSQTTKEKEREIVVSSDFLNGNVKGKFQFASLAQSFSQLIHNYLPSLSLGKKVAQTGNNQLNFDFRIDNTDIVDKLFHIPFVLQVPASLKGFFNERSNQVKLEGYFPNFMYDGSSYESGMILVDNPQEKLDTRMRITKQIDEESNISLAVKAEAKDDVLTTTLDWGNNMPKTYSGKFAAVTQFFKRTPRQEKLSAKVNILPSDIIINDSTWQLKSATIDIDSGRVAVDNFRFEHDKQHLYINGNMTNHPDDALCFDLNDIQLEYIFDIIKFDDVAFSGLASGKAYIRNTLKNPSLDTELKVREFKFNYGRMGEMKIKGQWNKEDGNIYLDADIRDTANTRTTVKGGVFIPKKSLDLHFTAQNTNLEFLNVYTATIFDKLTGRVNGELRLHGPFTDLNLEGTASGKAAVKVGILNTDYNLQLDSVALLRNAIEFRKASMTDKNGHKGKIRGSLFHNHLRDLSYQFNFDTENMLLFDTSDKTESVFYGTIYGTGSTALQGHKGELNVNINMRTDKNTLFIYNFGSPEEITSNSFITFRDKTPHPKWEKEKQQRIQKQKVQSPEIQETPTNIHINAQMEVTPDASIKVVMDPISGDYVMAQGHGHMQANFFNKGEFKMYGTYTLEHGVYKLSLQQVIRKDFQLQPGGTITFSGLPKDGDMNLQAVYTVNSASLKDLSPNAGFTQNSVKVNCLLNLTGKLASPDIHFDLELPNASDEEKDLVRSYINTDEQMEMQIIYLLGIGRFYTYDYAQSNAQSGSGQSSAMNSLLSSTLSGQLNNMLSNVINSNQWNFGTNLSTGDKGWTDMEVEGMLSGRLLNDRLLINGNFGYRDNHMANTNFIGDFDVQWLLTPSGDISLKGYNQTNDRYFTKTTLTTQGIGILFKRDFGNWRELFRRRKPLAEADTLKADTIQNKKRKPKDKKTKNKDKRKKWFWEL